MWLIINGVLWHSPKTNFTWSAHDTNLQIEFKNYTCKIIPHLTGANELILRWIWFCILIQAGTCMIIYTYTNRHICGAVIHLVSRTYIILLPVLKIPYVHYDDVIMTTIASQITSLTSVYSTVYSDADQRKHQSSASLAFVWGIHRDRWIPRTKDQLCGKCFYLMTSSWDNIYRNETSQTSYLYLVIHASHHEHYAQIVW